MSANQTEGRIAPVDQPPAGPALSYPGQPACRYCGQPLDRLRAGLGHCGAQGCETRRVQEAARAFYKGTWDNFVDHLHAGVNRAGAALVTAARMLGVEAGDMQVGVVPRQNRPVAPLPQERRAAFMAHFESVVAASFDAGVPELVGSRNRSVEVEEPPLTGAACVLCQGHCCTLGGDSHAFLAKSSIDDFRRLHPDFDARDVVAHYQDAIPAETVEHSCVYHGPLGCVLERTDRSSICNTFQCSRKRLLVQRLTSAGADRVVWIGLEDDLPPAIAVVDPENGYRPVPAKAQDGAISDAETAATRSAVLARQPEKLPELAAPMVIQKRLADP